VLFFDARKLMAQRRWAEACPKLEQSEQLDAGKGTEYNLADCYEHMGRIASAWGLFDWVVAAAEHEGLASHAALARKRRDALTPRVPILVLDVPPESRVEDLAIRCDGELLAADGWSKPLHLDPGHHNVLASAQDRTDWATEVDLTEGTSVTVSVPVLPREVTPEPPPVPVPAPIPPVPTIAHSPEPVALPPETRERLPQHAGQRQRVVALSAASAGAASLVVGGVFAGLSLASRSDAKQWCSTVTNFCTSPQGVADRSSALAQGNVATGFLIVGGVAVAASVVVWLTAPRENRGTRGALDGHGQAFVVEF
jgi:serine/threonine-protein kinase